MREIFDGNPDNRLTESVHLHADALEFVELWMALGWADAARRYPNLAEHLHQCIGCMAAASLLSLDAQNFIWLPDGQTS